MRPRRRTCARLAENASSPTVLRSRATLLRVLVAVLILAPGTAMAQRFDVVTFDAPPGWTQQPLGDGLMFETRPAPRAFCQVFLRQSRKPTAPLLQELDRVWSEMRQREPLVAAPGDPGQTDLAGGFKVAQRVGQAYGTITALNLLQKDDRLVPVVVNASDYDAIERCGPAIDDFMASLRLDETSAPASSPVPKSDPELAARFGNSVIGTWRFAQTGVEVTLNAPRQVRSGIQVQFALGGTYTITVDMSIPGSGGFSDDETGTYQVEGQRIEMRPKGTDKEPYDLDWFFGDRPGSPGDWGLILRAGSEGWLGSWGGQSDGWRTFKPAE